jgi:arginase
VAVKIVRQRNKIALLGAPTSAAAMSPGQEGAPAALRTAGLVAALSSAGYDLTDFGDDPAQVYKVDEESPRARNLPGVLASLEALKPRVEQAVKSGALPLILSGDCSVALATVAGVRRYFRHVAMIYMDRDADLQTPATTSTGCVDGMVVSHITGRGAAEMVRFWPEPPLVRDPDLALFGVERIEAAEKAMLERSPVRYYLAGDVQRIGPATAAKRALERIHGAGNQFILHLDVDVIADFPATNYPGSGGLRIEEVRQAMEIFAGQEHLAAIEITGYNPAKDPDSSCAKLVVELVAHVLQKRLEILPEATTQPSAAVAANAGIASATRETSAVASNSESAEAALPAAAAGEVWSSDSPKNESETSEECGEEPDEEQSGPSEKLDGSNS